MEINWVQRHKTLLPTYCDALDLGALEPGRVHRLAIALVEDGASRSVRVPVLVARGGRPGRVVGLTAALHGNELNGIPAIHSLFRRIDPAELHGTLVAVTVANMPAFTRFQRVYTDGADLNRTFPGHPAGSESQIYAHRLMDRIVRHFDVLIDLHTASFGRLNSFYVRADMTNPLTARMARQMGAEIILHNPSSDGTLRGAAEALGIASITVEIGDPHVFDADLVRESRIGLRDVLEHLRMVRPDDETATRTAVECVRSRWLYTDTGGMLSVFPQLTDRVREGEPIARLVDPWGQVLRTYTAPEAGLVIGKSNNPVARTGSRILHLGVPGDVPAPRSPADPEL
jgi:uncharacterized protein